jgi:hypothetical protein
MSSPLKGSSSPSKGPAAAPTPVNLYYSPIWFNMVGFAVGVELPDVGLTHHQKAGRLLVELQRYASTSNINISLCPDGHKKDDCCGGEDGQTATLHALLPFETSDVHFVLHGSEKQLGLGDGETMLWFDKPFKGEGSIRSWQTLEDLKVASFSSYPYLSKLACFTVSSPSRLSDLNPERDFELTAQYIRESGRHQTVPWQVPVWISFCERHGFSRRDSSQNPFRDRWLALVCWKDDSALDDFSPERTKDTTYGKNFVQFLGVSGSPRRRFPDKDYVPPPPGPKHFRSSKSMNGY